MRPLLTRCAAVLAFAGCYTDPIAPVQDDDRPGIALAKGSGSTSSAIRVHIAWDDAYEADGIPAGILGDGRGEDGSPGDSAYQGGSCGVFAEFIGATVEVSLYNATSCGLPRTHTFLTRGAAGPGIMVATKTLVRSLTALNIGQSSDSEFQGYHLGLPHCTRAVYDARYPGSSNPVRARLANTVDGARQWEVRSQSPHRAICIYTSKGKEVVGEATAPMPYRFIITEIPGDTGSGGGEGGGEPCTPKGKSGNC